MAFDKRSTRRAFREIIRMIQIDRGLLDKLASFVKRVDRDQYELTADLVAESNSFGLNQIWAWNYLMNTVPLHNGEREAAKFAAEIAFEFKYRRPTKWKFRKWASFEISEYVTFKIIRQHVGTEHWCKKEFMDHIFLGLGPWPVLDDVDDIDTVQVSAGGMPQRSFGTGPWPRGDGTD